jgi:hypothetical protein
VLGGFAQLAGGSFQIAKQLILEQVGELDELLTVGEEHWFSGFQLVRKHHRKLNRDLIQQK